MAADTLGDLRVDVQGVLFSRQWLLIYQLTHLVVTSIPPMTNKLANMVENSLLTKSQSRRKQGSPPRSQFCQNQSDEQIDQGIKITDFLIGFIL